MAEDPAPVFTTPDPIMVDPDNMGRMFSSGSLAPPLPSPSLKPRKTSVADRAQPIVSEYSPSRRKMSKAQQRRELMEGTSQSPQHQRESPVPVGADLDNDEEFGGAESRVRARTQRRHDSEFGDLSPQPSSSPVAAARGSSLPSSSTSPPSSSPSALAGASSPVGAGPAASGFADVVAVAASRAQDLPFDHAAPAGEAGQQHGLAGDLPLSDEQAWRDFVVEENYSVLATKGILQRISQFNQTHKAIQILKMQNAAVDEVDRANDEIHGMDQMEIQRQREKMGIKKKKSTRRVGKKGMDEDGSGSKSGDDNDDHGGGGGGGGGVGGAPDSGGRMSRSKSVEWSDDDDEFEASDLPRGSEESTPEQGVGGGGGRKVGKSKGVHRKNSSSGSNKPPPKRKNLFKSDFIVKMGQQMKKHINELCKRDYPRVRFSGRCHVNFLHGEELQRKTEYVSEVTLKNIGVRTAHVNLQQFGTSPAGSLFDLEATPQSFEISKGKKQVVTFRLVLHSSRAVVQEVVGVEIGWREGSKEAKTKGKSTLRFPRRLCVHVSARGEPAVFGVPLSQVEMVDWTPSRLDFQASDAGGKVPRLLVELKQHLLRTGGLQQEGIFRKAPGDVETQKAKRALNLGTFEPAEIENPQLYAHLIKLWFREMPVPVLHHTEEEELILCKELPACLKIVNRLPPVARTLFDWLLELMNDVVDHAAENFMNPANLGIVMGPNLLPNVDAANPMQALMLNKACTTFLTVLIKGHRADEVHISAT